MPYKLSDLACDAVAVPCLFVGIFIGAMMGFVVVGICFFERMNIRRLLRAQPSDTYSLRLRFYAAGGDSDEFDEMLQRVKRR